MLVSLNLSRKKILFTGGEGKFLGEMRHLTPCFHPAISPIQGAQDHLHEVSFIPPPTTTLDLLGDDFPNRCDPQAEVH